MRFNFIPRRLRHVPIVWWLAVLALAAVTGTIVSKSVAEAQASAARYADVVSVPVAERALAAGTVITEADFAIEEWPASFLPEAPLLDTAIGAVVSLPIDSGEPITERKVNGGSLSTAVGQLAEAEQGVAIALGEAAPPLELGDPVDVLAVAEVQQSDGSVSSVPATRIAADVRVIAISESAVTVAVPFEDAAPVAFAAAKGIATVVLTTPL